MSFRGGIFDLDGVIVNTVPLHFNAWKKLFTEYGKKFTFEDYLKKVDGIPRINGAKNILSDLSDSELQKATDKKQEYFLHSLKHAKIPIFKTTIKLIKELKNRNIRVAVISSSKNCPYILERTRLESLFDVQVNGNDITKGKPEPQIFLLAAERLKLSPRDCIAFEDAILGVEAAKRAGMVCVGIDRSNNPERLKKADIVVEDLSKVSYEKLKILLEKK